MEYNDIEDSGLLLLLSQGDVLAFETIYYRYTYALLGYAHKRISDREASEEIVQEIFIDLWERRNHLEHVTNLKAYLYAAVRHRIANHIAHSIIRVKYAQHYEAFATRHANTTEENLNVMDFNETLARNLTALPENCQKIFRMSRMEHKSIAEISAEMNLNPRTVENYITQALKHLRQSLNRP